MSFKKNDPKELIPRLLKGEVRALARVISCIEDNAPSAKQIIESIFPYTGKSHVIGVTGSPGAGKSTLVDQLATLIASREQKVAVLAVDPTSPFTGGAILGDRIRMSKASGLDGVFIRSMASRGSVGGLAPATAEAIFALEAAGYGHIIVETVGVGQGEVEIVRACDTCMVVLVPDMGDSVQALKAGIMEIADIFVINKADKLGADRLEKDLITMISLGARRPWKPTIVQTVASEGRGTEKLLDEMTKHRQWSEESGNIGARKNTFLTDSVYRLISRELLEMVLAKAKEANTLNPLLEQLYARKKDPLTIARELIAHSGFATK